MFMLAFAPDGIGCFISGEDRQGTAVGGKYTSASGWQDDFFPGDSHAVPVSLASDKNSGFHLLLYNLANGSLSYHFRSRETEKWTEDFRLDNALQLAAPPVLWVDGRQNLHIAWYQPRSNKICYRIKKAGGWPVGGWQPEQFLTLQSIPTLFSFYEEGEGIRPWCIYPDGRLNIFSLQSGIWEPIREETDFTLPVRFGVAGGELFNLASVLPPTDWYFLTMPARVNEPPAGEKDDQEQKLLEQIMQLMDEKRSLKALLQKKEESLAHYRLMLEQSSDSSNKQRMEWRENAGRVEGKLRGLEEDVRRRDKEIQSLKEQIAQNENKMAAQELQVKESRREVLDLNLKLAQFKQQEIEVRATIRSLEKELASKKGIWDTISSAFHKKE